MVGFKEISRSQSQNFLRRHLNKHLNFVGPQGFAGLVCNEISDAWPRLAVSSYCCLLRLKEGDSGIDRL